MLPYRSSTIGSLPVLVSFWSAAAWGSAYAQEVRAPELLDPGTGAAESGFAVADAPAPDEVLGHELGERFTDHAGVIRYMETLARASPLVQLREYGESVEGRRLVQVVIGREDHLDRLDEILRANRELSEPSTPEERAREIAATNPAIIYFSYGVHGNESSSSEAAVYTAWDLARGAASVDGVLDSAIVVIDPVVNPDGRDRYVNWFRQATGGLRPNASPGAWEHWEPWPGGRVNHYLFDLNRDWAWMTQPETRARLATWLYWTPQVHVDFHEMSWESSYFFFPATPPINPIYPEHTIEWGRIFGEANAEAFDERGWPYYTEESFDLFYPGYGDTWPSLVGAIGMTYEQAGHSRAGLAVERDDGIVLTLRDRAEGHRTTGTATLRAAAGRKGELLAGFAEFHRNIDDDLPDILLVPGRDPSRIEALVALLRAQGIRVERATREFSADAKAYAGFPERDEFAPGSFRVPARQPRGRLAITLLQPETFLDATYSYDVSAWSLPYAYGVEAHTAERLSDDADWQVVEDTPRVALAAGGGEGAATALFAEPWTGVWEGRASASPGSTFGAPQDGDGDSSAEEQPYGFLVPPGVESWPGVIRFLEAGGRASVLAQEFTLEERVWPAGTIFLPRHGVADLSERVRASGLEGRAQPIQSGLAAEGRDLGTDRAVRVQLPRLAVLTGPGVSATSFGAHWYFLERALGLRFDAVPVDRIRSVDLYDYDVLVLPEMAESALGSDSVEDIEIWVRRGGTVVGVGSGATRIAGPVGGIRVRERGEDDEDGDEEDENNTQRALRGREARDLDRWEQQIPGTVLSVRLDPDHPLAFGAGIDGDARRLFVLHRGGLVFKPDTTFESAGFFPAELEKISGVIAQENLERLAHGSWLATRSLGRGRVIVFADDPLFRHFWYSTFQPYVNAIMLGPTM